MAIVLKSGKLVKLNAQMKFPEKNDAVNTHAIDCHDDRQLSRHQQFFFHNMIESCLSRGKSLLESWGTTFLPD